VKMISMPQTVALLNGLGGAASAVAAWLTVNGFAATGFAGEAHPTLLFSLVSALFALAIGALTFSGSLIAAGKLNKNIPQKQVVLPLHQLITGLLALGILALIAVSPFSSVGTMIPQISAGVALLSLLFGVVFAIRVGGADMPITISLLNSTSGLAAAVAGLAISDILLISIGGIVGASGLILTQIMCRAMNRKLSSIIFAKAAAKAPADNASESEASEQSPAKEAEKTASNASPSEVGNWISAAKNIIIIPGYGMALSQAQSQIKALTEKLEAAGKNVRFAIHPVAGRMPGHMNVLLAEVDIPYDKLFEMDAINDDFAKSDVTIVVGASDVINPAASTLPNTPISGMPVLKASESPRLIICNFDLKPGYAGVANPLYEPAENIMLFLGDAKESLAKILSSF
jgi:NAD(P) transhydrogenase, beta subunit